LSNQPAAVPGLPPVTPPSGRFIAQLFLVPGLIVVVAVGILWSFTWLVGGSRTPQQFLKNLKNPNLEIRWRAASDLSQVLRRDSTLATDPAFALDLAELLRESVGEDNQGAKLASADLAKSRKEVQDRQTFIQFLIKCLGCFDLPTGVPVLSQVAVNEEGPDPASVALRRGGALTSLGSIGDRLKHLSEWSADLRQRVVETASEAEKGAKGERSSWARLTARYVAGDSAERPALGVADVFSQCARDSDPILRKLTAQAATVWDDGPQAEERLGEILLQLSNDDGHGRTLLVVGANGQALPDDPRLRGLETRYQAVLGLARRGSPLIVQRLEVLGEMLDQDRQAGNFQLSDADGRRHADEAVIATVETSALKALAELHQRRPEIDLSGMRKAVEKLAVSPEALVRQEADRTRLVMGWN
jgi:hypothetical protein